MDNRNVKKQEGKRNASSYIAMLFSLLIAIIIFSSVFLRIEEVKRQTGKEIAAFKAERESDSLKAATRLLAKF